MSPVAPRHRIGPECVGWKVCVCGGGWRCTTWAFGPTKSGEQLQWDNNLVVQHTVCQLLSISANYIV